MAKKKEPEVVDRPAGGMTLPGVSEDEQFVAQAGVHVLRFLKEMAGFFLTAGELERAAVATLEKAKALTPPQTADEDVFVQSFIKGTTADTRVAEDHWEITAVIHRFHRRMTGARSRTVDKLDEANAIGNRLHNGYTERKNREAAAEQDRIRREAEDKARRDREAELAKAEAAALAAEQSAPDLSEREARFVEELWRLVPPANAARVVGYKNPEATAEKLLALPKIQDALDAKRKAAAIREQAEAVKQQPLDVQHEEVKPDIGRAPDAHDRTTHSAELLDEAALIAAVISGKFGIPWDVLTVKPAMLNTYAKSMHELVNRWPGVRYKKDTKVV